MKERVEILVQGSSGEKKNIDEEGVDKHNGGECYSKYLSS